MCGSRRRERQALALQAYQSYLTSISHTQEQALLNNTHRSHLIPQDTHQQTLTYPSYGTSGPIIIAPPMPYGKHGRRGCCNHQRERRGGPITFVVKSIIKAVENSKQKKAAEKVREREMQVEGVVQGTVEKEEEWEQVEREGMRDEAPPSYEKIVARV